MNPTYRIADLAREFEVTTRTIRHYEDQGLLNPARQGVTRIFSARDRVRLKLALRGKRLGFSLQETTISFSSSYLLPCCMALLTASVRLIKILG